MSVIPLTKSMTAIILVSTSGLQMSYWLLNRLVSCLEWNCSGFMAACVRVSISVSIIL